MPGSPAYPFSSEPPPERALWTVLRVTRHALVHSTLSELEDTNEVEDAANELNKWLFHLFTKRLERLEEL